MCIYIYIHIYVYIHNIYIYIERDIDREREREILHIIHASALRRRSRGRHGIVRGLISLCSTPRGSTRPRSRRSP